MATKPLSESMLNVLVRIDTATSAIAVEQVRGTTVFAADGQPINANTVNALRKRGYVALDSGTDTGGGLTVHKLALTDAGKEALPV